jgi:hypothetical protein
MRGDPVTVKFNTKRAGTATAGALNATLQADYFVIYPGSIEHSAERRRRQYLVQPSCHDCKTVALRTADNLRDAFVRARSLVRERETREGFTPSNPQMAGGENVQPLLVPRVGLGQARPRPDEH